MIRSRLVVTEMVYHQTEPEPAMVVQSQFVRRLKTDDSPFTRRSNATTSWLPLCSAGTVADEASPSMLVIQNLEGKVQTVQPTEEERVMVAERVIILGVAKFTDEMTVAEFGQIPPGESCRITPENFSQYRIRCRKGVARYSLTLIPG